MKKPIPQSGKPLSRREMLERHQRQDYEDAANELNEFSRRALSGLQYHSGEKLETTFRRLDQKLGANRRTFPIRRIMSIAAATLALVVAGYFVLSQPLGSNSGSYAQHFSYLPSAIPTDGGERGNNRHPHLLS